MRVNVYAEEMPDPPRIEIISKEIEGQTFTGLRIYLELPASFIPRNSHTSTGYRAADRGDSQQAMQFQAPFIHRPGDDDSAAITFWGKRDLRKVLKMAEQLLDKHYAKHKVQESIG